MNKRFVFGGTKGRKGRKINYFQNTKITKTNMDQKKITQIINQTLINFSDLY